MILFQYSFNKAHVHDALLLSVPFSLYGAIKIVEQFQNLNLYTIS